MPETVSQSRSDITATITHAENAAHPPKPRPNKLLAPVGAPPVNSNTTQAALAPCLPQTNMPMATIGAARASRSPPLCRDDAAYSSLEEPIPVNSYSRPSPLQRPTASSPPAHSEPLPYRARSPDACSPEASERQNPPHQRSPNEILVRHESAAVGLLTDNAAPSSILVQHESAAVTVPSENSYSRPSPLQKPTAPSPHAHSEPLPYRAGSPGACTPEVQQKPPHFRAPNEILVQHESAAMGLRAHNAAPSSILVRHESTDVATPRAAPRRGGYRTPPSHTGPLTRSHGTPLSRTPPGRSQCPPGSPLFNQSRNPLAPTISCAKLSRSSHSPKPAPTQSGRLRFVQTPPQPPACGPVHVHTAASSDETACLSEPVDVRRTLEQMREQTDLALQNLRHSNAGEAAGEAVGEKVRLQAEMDSIDRALKALQHVVVSAQSQPPGAGRRTEPPRTDDGSHRMQQRESSVMRKAWVRREDELEAIHNCYLQYVCSNIPSGEERRLPFARIKQMQG
jgi:hypothetical protein